MQTVRYRMTLSQIYRCNAEALGSSPKRCVFMVSATYADILHTQRLRTTQGRTLVIGRRNHIEAALFNSPPRSTASQTLWARYRPYRNLDGFLWNIPIKNSGPDTAQAVCGPIEAVATCVQTNWPCLLVGHLRAGRMQCWNSNIHIETAMSSLTDVTDLIGCFYQSTRNRSKCHENDEPNLCHRLSSQHVDADLLWSLAKKYQPRPFKIQMRCDAVRCAEALAIGAQWFATICSSWIAFCRESLSMVTQYNLKDAQSPFQWVDGTHVITSRWADRFWFIWQYSPEDV